MSYKVQKTATVRVDGFLTTSLLELARKIGKVPEDATFTFVQKYAYVDDPEGHPNYAEVTFEWEE